MRNFTICVSALVKRYPGLVLLLFRNVAGIELVCYGVLELCLDYEFSYIPLMLYSPKVDKGISMHVLDSEEMSCLVL